jgi:hypothetical protein
MSSVPRSALPRFAPAKYVAVFAGRVLFPFSIIPGGIGSSLELRNAIGHDPVVARHYADFDWANARVVPLDREQFVYLSYRIGNEVFWTKRTFTLRKGETVITDGTHAARTRCGNRFSATPQAPVSRREPTPEAFETVPDHEYLNVVNAPISSLLGLLPLSNSVPAEKYLAQAEDTTFLAPAIPPVWWGQSSPPIIPVGLPPSHPPVVPPPPPVPVPESSTILLLLWGLLGCWLIRKTRTS